MTRSTLIALLALSTLAACDRAEQTTEPSAQHQGSATSPGDQVFAASEAAMHTEMAGATGQTVDEAYIAKMIAHHRGAVAMADVALAQSRDPGILRMAQTVKDTQTAEIAEMQAWEPAPPAPTAPVATPPTASAATTQPATPAD